MNLLNQFLLLASTTDATKANVYNMQNYMNYESFFMFPINTIKWIIIKFFYGMANFASTVLDDVIGTNSFITKELTGKGGVLTPWMKGAQSVAWAIMAVALVWMAVKMVVAKQPPQIKNVLIQLAVAVFLVLFTGTITKSLVNFSVNTYKGITEVQGSKKNNTDTSSLPFDVIHSNTNDLEYILLNDFKTSKSTAATGKNPLRNSYGKVMKNPPKLKYGYNVLTKKQLDKGEVQLDQILNWDNVDNGKKLVDVDDAKFKKDGSKWDDGKKLSMRLVWYRLQTYTDEDGKKQFDVPDVPRIGTTVFSLGGYPRYTVDFLPTIITLIAISIAYLFAGYAIIKSFLELGLMNILGIFIFAADLDSGNKTKQVVNAIFSTSLLVALQGLEIAFYRIAMIYGSNAKTAGKLGTGMADIVSYARSSLKG